LNPDNPRTALETRRAPSPDTKAYTSTLGTAPGTLVVQDSQVVGVSPKRFMRLIVSQ